MYIFIKAQELRLIIIVSILLLPFGFVSSYGRDNNDMAYFTNIGLTDGLSQLSVLNICQDSKGFMWFG